MNHINYSINTSKPLPIVLSQFNQYLFYDYTQTQHHISTLSKQLLALEKLIHQPQSTTKKLTQTYLPKPVPQPLPQLEEITSTIDKVIQTAEMELQPKQKAHQINQMYDDYQPPKQVKATLDPYRQSQKQQPKTLKRQSSFAAKTQTQQKPQRSGSTNRYTPTAKKDTKAQPKQQQNPPKQPPKQVNAQTPTSQPIPPQIAQPIPQSQHKPEQPKPQQPPPNSQNISQPLPAKQPDSEWASFSEMKKEKFLEQLNLQSLREYGKVKRQVEGKQEEIVQSFKYYREKEQKARMRFLTKFHQHSQLKVSVGVGEEKSELKNKQLVEAVEKSMGITELYFKSEIVRMEYCELLTNYIRVFLDVIDKFDLGLIETMKKLKQSNLKALKNKDLVDIFRKWSLINFFKQNTNALLSHEEPEGLLQYYTPIMAWLGVRPQKGKVERQREEPEVSQRLRLVRSSHEQQMLRLCIETRSHEDALVLNGVIRQATVLRFLECVVGRLEIKEKEVRKSLEAVKVVLSQVYFGGRVRQTIFSRQDWEEYALND